MSCNWDVFMQEICVILGYNSENAQKYIKKGSDYHKLWQILEIIYIALADKLLLPYVRKSSELGEKPTSSGYWNYSESTVSPNYQYAQQALFNFPYALMMLRRGVRFGQSKPILVAKSKLLLLFFGSNHPRYQEIVSHDFRIECMIPNEVKQCMHSTFSMSRNRKDGHYQGGDAIIEEINKQSKKWIIRVPTEMQWQRSFRTLDVLEEVGVFQSTNILVITFMM